MCHQILPPESLLNHDRKSAVKVWSLKIFNFLADKSVYNRQLTEERPLQQQVSALFFFPMSHTANISSNIRSNRLYGHSPNNLNPANIMIQTLRGRCLLNIFFFHRLQRQTVWRLPYSQLVSGHLIANQFTGDSSCSVSCKNSSSAPRMNMLSIFFVDRGPAACRLQGVRSGQWWLYHAKVFGRRPEIKGALGGTGQKGRPICSRWIRFHQEPPSCWWLRFDQEGDGLRQVPRCTFDSGWLSLARTCPFCVLAGNHTDALEEGNACVRDKLRLSGGLKDGTRESQGKR